MQGADRGGVGGVVTAAVAACLAGSVGAASPQSKETAQPPNAATEASNPLAVGEDAYVYGYPMMVLDQTKQSLAGGVTNRFAYMPTPPSAADKRVVRSNVDTLYAMTFLDLSAEPVVIHVPDTHGRYYVMQMLDANTNVFASPGKRTTGTDARDFVVVGPGWHQPVQLASGMTAIHSPTNSVWIINRTELDGDKDIDAVNAIQQELAIAPLSEWPKGAIKAVPLKGESTRETPPAEVQGMSAPDYFNKLALLLRDNPPATADAAILKRFATIGLAPGKSFDPSPDLALILEKAKERALESIKGREANLGELVNGWRVITKKIGTYGTDYLQRAAVTEYGLGANLPADAVYPGASVDAAGRPLEGDRPYVLHFDKGALPPVNAFWSLTMYDKDGYFVDNPLKRYAARDSLLHKNSDGSVDIYLQADSPGKDREPNWLPTPKDAPFTLLLRMYWPKEPVLDGAYRPPGVARAAAK
jgi:hypothetical protein